MALLQHQEQEKEDETQAEDANEVADANEDGETAGDDPTGTCTWQLALAKTTIWKTCIIPGCFG